MLVLGYAAWLGWPPPATRAAALFTVLVVGRQRQRALRADGVLGASALLVLSIDPLAVVDLGAWLSFAAMAGLLWATRWYRRQAPEPRLLVEATIASVGATLFTAPIAALTIGRVAAIGPAVNLVAIPVAAALMPALLAALLLEPLFPAVGSAFAAITTVLLTLLDRIATLGASLPGAAGPAAPGWPAALPWLVLLVLGWQAVAGNATPREAVRRMGWGTVAFVWLPLMGTLPVRRDHGDTLAVHFLDVGQGDAAVLRTPAGRWLMIDAGPVTNTHDAGARVVLPFLRRHGVRALELMVLSHAHRDHFGGAGALVAALPIGVVVEPGAPVADERYLALLDSLAMHRVRWRPVSAGMRWQIDGVTIDVLSPSKRIAARTGDLNEDSVVLLLRHGAFAMLFTGDAGMVTEPVWGAEPIDADLLKVGHHGAAAATSQDLLVALGAKAAVVSLGRNSYGHPAPSTLSRLRAAGISLWRTDREGTVSVESDGRTFRVRGGRTTATFDARDPTPESPACCTRPR
jgi:competence protein ComEC